MKPFTSIATAFLAIVAILQLARVLLGWTVVVNDYVVPDWASIAAFVIAGMLATMLYREHR
ncbi:MAG: hypothetical protein ABJA62_00460 [Luteimonas sp.]